LTRLGIILAATALIALTAASPARATDNANSSPPGPQAAPASNAAPTGGAASEATARPETPAPAGATPSGPAASAAPDGADAPSGKVKRQRRVRTNTRLASGRKASVRYEPPSADLPNVPPAAGTASAASAESTVVPQTSPPPTNKTFFGALFTLPLATGKADNAPAKTEPPAQPTEGAVNRASPLHDLIARHAAENGVPFGLADAVIRIESRYNAGIVHAGNYGLMQLRAQTARGMGFSGSPAALLDPETNLRFGMKYLAEAYRLGGGDICRAVMRYQSGLGATRFSAANRIYCARARAIMAGP